MDPQENLREQLMLATRILARDGTIRTIEDGTTTFDLVTDADRLAELVMALDEWRRGGGFDPYLAI